MIPQLSLAHRVVFHALRELAAKHATLIPGARLAAKENSKGELVLAIIPAAHGLAEPGRERT
jgi:hypothetical protein